MTRLNLIAAVVGWITGCVFGLIVQAPLWSISIGPTVGVCGFLLVVWLCGRRRSC